MAGIHTLALVLPLQSTASALSNPHRSRLASCSRTLLQHWHPLLCGVSWENKQPTANIFFNYIKIWLVFSLKLEDLASLELGILP